MPVVRGGESLTFINGRYYHNNLASRAKFHAKLEASARQASELSMSLVPRSADFGFSGSGIQNSSAENEIADLSRVLLRRSESLGIGRTPLDKNRSSRKGFGGAISRLNEAISMNQSVINSNSHLNAHKSGNSFRSSKSAADRDTSVRRYNQSLAVSQLDEDGDQVTANRNNISGISRNAIAFDDSFGGGGSAGRISTSSSRDSRLSVTDLI